MDRAGQQRPWRRAESRLWLPLAVALLATLHLAFALARLCHVLNHLATTAFFSRAAAAPSIQLDKARKRWRKMPKHLAVVFVPSSPAAARWHWPWRIRQRSLEEMDLEKLLKDLKLLLGWCESLNIASLSVYDERGVLDRNATVVQSVLSAHVPILPPQKAFPRTKGFATFRVALTRLAFKDELSLDAREVDSGCGVSDSSEFLPTPASSTTTQTLVARFSDPEPRTSPACLRVNLISRLAGRPQLAKVAQELCARGEEGVKVADGAVEELMQLSLITEPDLLLVLGGPYLRLRGFPPWQLRLTEMYHYSAPSWLPAPPLTYTVLRSALDVYGGAEMRLGR